MYIIKQREVSYVIHSRMLELDDEVIDTINKRFTQLHNVATGENAQPLSKSEIIDLWEGQFFYRDDEQYWSHDFSCFLCPRDVVRSTIEDLIRHNPDEDGKGGGIIDTTYSNTNIAEN